MKSFLLPALASLACAGSTITSMFLPGFSKESIVASVAGNDDTATTYSMTCAASYDNEEECGMGNGLTVVKAGKAMTYMMDEGDAYSFSGECTVDGTTAACTGSATGSGDGLPASQTYKTYAQYVPVTITAGSITDATAALTATSMAEGTGTAAQASPTASEAAEETADGSGAEATPTGAAAQITGAGSILFGGAVVLMAAAL
ncbi:hypothetical protein AN6471.2 [Aspergillus nidulans FGSC A4]|uniref:Uncharacterized protein n=1 Tax=Emericella nidulans (strain FGSC A4 / ATCC 38163 / CBS 112.46 / NRRL 194 / M139) TaxID=227321 RepID=Q5AZ09_EMENI|nr:hypothetical protein [Aspergillus nidulans FGSC A4]EAA58493.1 hypothetical protein AN6471.2 [Aspergillus nidulans FGSC A4]CBF69396.1 TPA: hypothetical protein ANIA_06471 [Aspergillus nidulans FGSC A4]|eukprot:XP_664075.1 hypothetical protein AN6471.2 [Aspergillus nidulans FGSC A4]